ncbi:MAG TPA: hypothetical protein VNV42_03725 [Solirubrobacteraceae bacterium]|jgi:Tfp pilus assembly protein PilN|nr:hypothetical protein [Solirubrobacteraceae bacterium]
MRAVNLIPAEQRKGGAVGRRSQGAAFAVLGLLAGAAILVFLYGSAKHQAESRKAEAAALTARAQRVQSQAAALTSYTSFTQMQEQRLQEIAGLINSRFDWDSAMGELSRVLPADVALSSLQATVGAESASAASTASKSSSASSSSPSTASASTGSASVSSATAAGATPTVTLQGCAFNQVAVAQTLVRLRLMSGVTNVTLQSSTKSSSGGGASGGGAGGSSASCPKNDPVFSIDIAYQPLPSPPATSAEAIESTASGTHPGGGAKRVSTDGGAAKPAAGPHAQTVSNRVKGAPR